MSEKIPNLSTKLIPPNIAEGDEGSANSFKRWLNENIAKLTSEQSEKLKKMGPLLANPSFDSDVISTIQRIFDVSNLPTTDTSTLMTPTPKVAVKSGGSGRRKPGVASATTKTLSDPDAVPSGLTSEQFEMVKSQIERLNEQKAEYQIAMKEVGAGELKGKWKEILSDEDEEAFQSYFMSLGRVKSRGEQISASGKTESIQSFRESADTVLWYGEHVAAALEKYKGATEKSKTNKMEKLASLINPDVGPSDPSSPADPAIPARPSIPSTPPVPDAVWNGVLNAEVQNSIDKKKSYKGAKAEYEAALSQKNEMFAGGLRSRLGLDPAGAKEAKKKMEEAKALYASDLAAKLQSRAVKQNPLVGTDATKIAPNSPAASLRGTIEGLKTGELEYASPIRAAMETDEQYALRSAAIIERRRQRAEVLLEQGIKDKYRPYFIQRFFVDDAHGRLEKQKELLSTDTKERLQRISSYLKKKKWTFRAVALGAAVAIPVAAVAGTAGIGAAALAGGAGAAGWGFRLLASTTAGTGAYGIAHNQMGHNVERKRRSLVSHEDKIKNSGYEDLLANMDSFTDGLEKSFKDVKSAEKLQKGTAVAAGAATAFAVGGAASLAESSLSIQDIVDSMLDNHVDANQVAEYSSRFANPPAVSTTELPSTISDVPDDLSDKVDEVYPGGATRVENFQGDSVHAAEGVSVIHPETQVAGPFDNPNEIRSEGHDNPVPTERNNYVGNHIEVNQAVTAEVVEPGPVAMSEVGELTSPTDGSESVPVPGLDSEVLSSDADMLATTEPQDNVAEFQNLVPNPEQMLTVPKDCSVSEALLNAFKAGELQGLPEGMTQREFLNKLWPAIHELDNNEAVMARMQMPSGDLDKIAAGSTFNASPIIEHMMGKTVPEIESGLFSPDEALSREVPVPNPSAVSESIRPEARPSDLTATELAPTESIRPEARSGEVGISVSGNFEVLAGNSFVEVFGKNVEIPDSYKVSLQTELNEWSKANNIVKESELSDQLEAMMSRDQILVNAVSGMGIKGMGIDSYDYWPATKGGETIIENLKDSQFTGSQRSSFLASTGLNASILDKVSNSISTDKSIGNIILEAVRTGQVEVVDGQIIYPNTN